MTQPIGFDSRWGHYASDAQRPTVAPVSRKQAVAQRFWLQVDRRDPESCWPWKAGTKENGYGYYRLDGRRVYAHRVALLLVDVDVYGKVVRHLCNNPPCCNPNHLAVGTHAENSADMVSMGRSLRGERCPRAKLTAAQVAEIRALRAGGKRLREIAVRFGVTSTTVSHIARGKTWRPEVVR